MTRDELKAIKRREGQATCGPWYVDADGDVMSETVKVPMYADEPDNPEKMDCRIAGFPYSPEGSWHRKNAEFVARARTDVPALVDALEDTQHLLREAYNELNTIDAITVSPSDTDGLIELLRRIREHLGDKE